MISDFPLLRLPNYLHASSCLLLNYKSVSSAWTTIKRRLEKWDEISALSCHHPMRNANELVTLASDDRSDVCPNVATERHFSEFITQEFSNLITSTKSQILIVTVSPCFPIYYLQFVRWKWLKSIEFAHLFLLRECVFLNTSYIKSKWTLLWYNRVSNFENLKYFEITRSVPSL